ncbi:hypothetical protein RKD45_002218 [Streptomyces griseus]
MSAVADVDVAGEGVRLSEVGVPDGVVRVVGVADERRHPAFVQGRDHGKIGVLRAGPQLIQVRGHGGGDPFVTSTAGGAFGRQVAGEPGVDGDVVAVFLGAGGDGVGQYVVRVLEPLRGVRRRGRLVALRDVTLVGVGVRLHLPGQDLDALHRVFFDVPEGVEEFAPALQGHDLLTDFLAAEAGRGHLQSGCDAPGLRLEDHHGLLTADRDRHPRHARDAFRLHKSGVRGRAVGTHAGLDSRGHPHAAGTAERLEVVAVDPPPAVEGAPLGRALGPVRGVHDDQGEQDRQDQARRGDSRHAVEEVAEEDAGDGATAEDDLFAEVAAADQPCGAVLSELIRTSRHGGSLILAGVRSSGCLAARGPRRRRGRDGEPGARGGS